MSGDDKSDLLSIGELARRSGLASSAIRFYERLGYERVAMRRRFYGADGLDALVYRKELASL